MTTDLLIQTDARLRKQIKASLLSNDVQEQLFTHLTLLLGTIGALTETNECLQAEIDTRAYADSMDDTI